MVAPSEDSTVTELSPPAPLRFCAEYAPRYELAAAIERDPSARGSLGAVPRGRTDRAARIATAFTCERESVAPSGWFLADA